MSNTDVGTGTSGMTIKFDTGHFNQRSSLKRIGTKIGTAHELAHVWSNKWGDWPEVFYAVFTSKESAGPTAYGSLDKKITWATNPVSEHFAESFAMYVYPNYADARRRYVPDTTNPGDVEAYKRDMSLDATGRLGLSVNQAEVMRILVFAFGGRMEK